MGSGAGDLRIDVQHEPRGHGRPTLQAARTRIISAVNPARALRDVAPCIGWGLEGTCPKANRPRVFYYSNRKNSRFASCTTRPPRKHQRTIDKQILREITREDSKVPLEERWKFAQTMAMLLLLASLKNQVGLLLLSEVPSRVAENQKVRRIY